MELVNVNINGKERISIPPPKKYHVIFHNDDFTTMEFVVMLLEKVFLKSRLEAESIMLDVHLKGKGTVGSYSYDLAISKQRYAQNLARQEGFPLRITVE